MSALPRRSRVWRATALGIGVVVAGVGLAGGAVWFGDSPAPAVTDGRSGARAHDERTVVLAGAIPHGVAPPDSPNVVLVLGCTVRRDQVTPYGGHPAVTPFLAEMATEGAVLADPIAAAPWTRAASAALLTGHHPVGLGLVEPGPDRNDRVLPAGVQTLAERFAAHGYTTVGATGNPNLNAVYGFEQGFDRYLQPRALWRENRAKLSGRALLHDLFEVLDTRPAADRPLYLQVMFVDAHAPWLAEPEEIGRVRDPAVPKALWPYRAGLRRLDDSVRALWAGLNERGFTADNTVLMFASDHGEGLSTPSHHGRSHGRYLYPSAVHAAVLAMGEGIPAGHRVHGPASGVDLAPTLLGLAGLSASFETPDPPVDLSPALRGERDTTGRDRAFSDTWFMTADRTAFYETGRACMTSFASQPTPGPTGVFTPGCYDRGADPEFRRAESNASADSELASWRTEQLDAAARWGTSTATPDADLDRQLEALGYVQRESEETSP